MKVLITGASGVLGKAVLNAFKSTKGDILVTGLSFTNGSAEYMQLDLLDSSAVENFFYKTWKGGKGDVVVHCAAERRPDVAEKHPDTTRKLNSEVPGHLARLSKLHSFALFYISTDYVFDGTCPPYAPNGIPNPVNLYGKTKLGGEQAILSLGGPDAIVIRVPVLYGPAPKPSDSAINIILDVVRDQSGKTYKMDHFATRYPTNVIDIGNFLVRLTGIKKELPRIIHYSAPEPYTKYEIALLFSSILGLNHSHIVPDETDPNVTSGTLRPKDCKLDTQETEILVDGIPGGVLGCVGFEEWWRQELSKP